jgi:hypothetical protein
MSWEERCERECTGHADGGPVRCTAQCKPPRQLPNGSPNTALRHTGSAALRTQTQPRRPAVFPHSVLQQPNWHHIQCFISNAPHYPLDYLYQKDERAEPGELQASTFCHPLSHVVPCLYRRAVLPFGRHPEGGGSRLFRYLGIVYQTTRCHAPEYFSPNTILVSTVRRAVDTPDTAIN